MNPQKRTFDVSQSESRKELLNEIASEFINDNIDRFGVDDFFIILSNLATLYKKVLEEELSNNKTQMDKTVQHYENRIETIVIILNNLPI